MNLFKTELILSDRIARAWQGKDPFAIVRTQSGDIYRELEGRRTLRFELAGEAFFLKVHQGIGWLEVIKNLIQLRLPIVGASNEWQAINRLHEIGVHTMTAVGYGRRGVNPATLLSFIITEELRDTLSLEDMCERWPAQPPGFAFKQAVIKQVAEIAKRIHEHGINHRDFYLCHFLADVSCGEENLNAENLTLYLVDLHRAQLRRKTPLRWIIKDLGGLYFSALDIGLTSRDVWRFMRYYSGKSLRELQSERDFWLKVKARARHIQVRYRGIEPNFPLA